MPEQQPPDGNDKSQKKVEINTKEEEKKDGKVEKKVDIWDMNRIRSSSRNNIESEEELQRMAQWVTSWMLPWERDHLDGTKRELTPYEEYYWLGLCIFGGAGLSWEIYVAQNSRLFKPRPKRVEKKA